jgi:hypothetical protein
VIFKEALGFPSKTTLSRDEMMLDVDLSQAHANSKEFSGCSAKFGDSQKLIVRTNLCKK